MRWTKWKASQKANEEYRREHRVNKKGIDLVSIFRNDKAAEDVDRHNRDVLTQAAQVKGKRNARASALIARELVH